ncbi:DNA-binding SARP family transcriptional activator [Krasilnikovia cinnamomea]|uniref:DNA-binding SARP family transcriptional activator n=1 Tax=Krasilnikovia cinnamomea TaxID=349313 RepID=A0A4Q7ZFS3_9ACTN|nr:AfsR/SARP family transcriptional regulator [Krasilnikovia cinnamomea]RZU49151.1 DNA-binding SARP family transcriptional activator [Krasilnikovia cinnamomea]
MAGELTFHLFGPLRVCGADGRCLALGSRTRRAVLAVLLLRPGQLVPVERIIGQLWHGAPPPGAAAHVHDQVAALREALETAGKSLVGRENGYLMDVAPERIDVCRFAGGAAAGREALTGGQPAGAARTLDAALAEWRGDPLADFPGEPFTGPTIAQLENLRAQAVQDRAEARLLLGDAGWCVTELDRLVRETPYRERLWELYAAALYRAGRRDDALAAIARVRDLLFEELGLQDGPGLRALERAVRDDDLAAIPGGAPPTG